MLDGSYQADFLLVMFENFDGYLIAHVFYW